MQKLWKSIKKCKTYGRKATGLFFYRTRCSIVQVSFWSDDDGADFLLPVSERNPNCFGPVVLTRFSRFLVQLYFVSVLSNVHVYASFRSHLLFDICIHRLHIVRASIFSVTFRNIRHYFYWIHIFDGQFSCLRHGLVILFKILLWNVVKL